jgi:plastocyanin
MRPTQFDATLAVPPASNTAAPLGTTQLVRYTFADSWGCHLQATLPAAQRISGAAPNQVLQCPTVPGAVYVKQDAPCQFACDENHTRTGDTCTRVCGNTTAAACEPRHFASTICTHAGYTLYQCQPCAYATGQQALPWSALTAGTCPTAPCAAGTYGAGGVCVPCSQDNFSTAGSAACSPCARGTFAPVGSGVCATCFQDTYALTQPGFGDAGVSITPGVMVVLKWPSSAHPVLLSINTNVAWNNPVTYDAPSFAVNVDATLLQTTFTVPESYTGALYYICQLHSSMGVHAITLLANTPCVAGAAATRSVAAIDAYFARALAAGHNVSQHNQLSAFCHARGACLPCLPGEFEQAGACVACDFAHYQPNFQMPRCFECATGHNTSARGSRLAADCRCEPGFE